MTYTLQLLLSADSFVSRRASQFNPWSFLWNCRYQSVTAISKTMCRNKSCSPDTSYSNVVSVAVVWRFLSWNPSQIESPILIVKQHCISVCLCFEMLWNLEVYVWEHWKMGLSVTQHVAFVLNVFLIWFGQYKPQKGCVHLFSWSQVSAWDHVIKHLVERFRSVYVPKVALRYEVGSSLLDISSNSCVSVTDVI